jgi:outer membrane protein assembly factor BamD (BamD/ComL family)
MLKRFAPLFLLAAIVCLGAGACEQKKTQAEVQAEKVKTFRKQQMDKAIASYKELIAKYPDSEFAPEAKARLQKLQPAGSPTPRK